MKQVLPIVCALAAASAVIMAFFPFSPVREDARRSVAASNLRQIGQATLIYASDHQDKLPTADNVWDYAAELARGGGLDDASIWCAGGDPANSDAPSGSGTVLTADRRSVNAEFRRLAPSWAVPLGDLAANMPATMPVAWTRGLRPDGTWSHHGPYGTTGGHVVFLGGNVTFLRDPRNAFQRFDGSGTTSNILEALPPGTRIGEYVPNENEARSWAETRRRMEMAAMVRPMIGPALWVLALVTLIVQVARKRWSMDLLAAFLLLSFLAAILMPTV